MSAWGKWVAVFGSLAGVVWVAAIESWGLLEGGLVGLVFVGWSLFTIVSLLISATNRALRPMAVMSFVGFVSCVVSMRASGQARERCSVERGNVLAAAIAEYRAERGAHPDSLEQFETTTCMGLFRPRHFEVDVVDEGFVVWFRTGSWETLHRAPDGAWYYRD